MIDALHVSVLLGPAGVLRDISLRPTVLVTCLFVVMATLHNLHKQHIFRRVPKVANSDYISFLSVRPPAQPRGTVPSGRILMKIHIRIFENVERFQV